MTLTASFGVSEWIAGESMDETLRRADMALYSAKTAGATAWSPPTTRWC